MVLKQIKNKIWQFTYCPCIHESAYVTMSLHYSKEGAEKAMVNHKEEKRKEWQLLVDSDEEKGSDIGFDKICPFGQFEYWQVNEIEILP